MKLLQKYFIISFIRKLKFYYQNTWIQQKQCDFLIDFRIRNYVIPLLPTLNIYKKLPQKYHFSWKLKLFRR